MEVEVRGFWLSTEPLQSLLKVCSLNDVDKNYDSFQTVAGYSVWGEISPTPILAVLFGSAAQCRNWQESNILENRWKVESTTLPKALGFGSHCWVRVKGRTERTGVWWFGFTQQHHCPFPGEIPERQLNKDKTVTILLYLSSVFLSLHLSSTPFIAFLSVPYPSLLFSPSKNNPYQYI